MDIRRDGSKRIERAAMKSLALLDTLERPRSGIPVALLFGGVVSLLRGVDTNWDLRNYHFYNPWAWWHGRLGFDYAPAQLQSYHNPLPDLPFFALVAAGLPAYAIAFLMGLPFGLGAWFFYRISRAVVRDLALEPEWLALLGVGLVGLTGAAGFSQIGSTMNEWVTAALVLAALFLLVRSARDAAAPVAVTAVAGLLAGAATGFKLTAAIYAVALGAIVVLCFRGRRRHAWAIVAFAAATAVGFILSYGYWALVLWQRFGNPFFPYFNGLFRSPYWDPTSFFDTKFHPTTLIGWLARPFGLAVRNRLASEADLRDPRLALLVVVAAVLVFARWRAARAAGERLHETLGRSVPATIRLLAVFAAAAYAVWLGVFAIYRYAIPLELVASLLLVVGLHKAFAGTPWRDALIAAVVVVVVATTLRPYWGRARLHAGPYFDVAVPPVPADALVLMMTGQPFGYLVPFIDSGPRVIAAASNFTGPWKDNRLQREMATLIKAQRGALYAIRYLDATDTGEELTMAAYGLRRLDSECLPIRSNLEDRPVVLCPLHRDARAP